MAIEVVITRPACDRDVRLRLVVTGDPDRFLIREPPSRGKDPRASLPNGVAREDVERLFGILAHQVPVYQLDTGILQGPCRSQGLVFIDVDSVQINPVAGFAIVATRKTPVLALTF